MAVITLIAFISVPVILFICIYKGDAPLYHTYPIDNLNKVQLYYPI